ncbi:MAG TPA: acyltransferase [Caulobacteraceae bacterium]
MIGGMIRQGLKLGRALGSAWRRAVITLAYPGVKLGPGVAVGRGAVVKATDGGAIEIGARTSVGAGCVLIAKGGRLSIGADGYVGDGCVITCRQSIVIGDDALIAEHVTIRDQDHAFDDPDTPIRLQGFVTAPVAIGRDVWLGAKTTIAKGVTVGDGAVVGAGSIATKDVPAFAVAAGAPAKVLRSRRPSA